MMEEKQKDYKKALAVAIKFLNHRDRTEYEIIERLKKDDYPDSIISEVIVFLKEQGYVNDTRYAEYYFICYMEKRSVKRIETELIKRGIESSVVERAKCSVNVNQHEAVRRALKKQLIKRRIDDYSMASYEEKNLIKAALYRQGYSVGDISEVLENTE